MAAYATMGVDLKFLITASFMAAPGGLLMAKMLLPETEHDHVQHIAAPFLLHSHCRQA